MLRLLRLGYVVYVASYIAICINLFTYVTYVPYIYLRSDELREVFFEISPRVFCCVCMMHDPLVYTYYKFFVHPVGRKVMSLMWLAGRDR